MAAALPEARFSKPGVLAATKSSPKTKILPRDDENFGGVFYVFVRGADPAHPHLGIHRTRPDRDRIENLNALFSGSRKSLV